jgi:CRP-like cAMP-binding protein
VVFGRVALTVHRAKGRERVAEILGAGRTFGETVMFLDKPYIVGARAMSDALVLHVAKDTILAELERSAGFARRMIAGLAAKLHATVGELDLYALGSGGQRFAAWLLHAAGDGDAAATVVLPASKRAIASKLNLSAEHLSRVLRTLSDKGLIRIAGRTLEIPDRARLREWAQA